MEFKFEKKGFTFYFRNPRWESFDKVLKMEYKIIGIKENKDHDGYYYNSTYLPERKAMTFYGVKIDGQEISGVELPEDIATQVEALYNEMEDREYNADLKFQLYNCDYGFYTSNISYIIDRLKYRSVIYDATEIALNALNKDEEIKAIALSTYQAYPENPNWTNEYLESHRKAVANNTASGYGIIPNAIVKQKIIDLIGPMFEEKKRADEEKKRIYEEKKASMVVNIIKKGSHKGDDGTDYYALIKITDPKTGESLEFNCRNIFDFGYVVNPNYSIVEGKEKGGIVNNWMWQDFESGKGWFDVRPVTEFEKKCLQYLSDFPPVYDEIRL